MTVTWNAANAAHLLRRAGFGPTPKEVARALRQGRNKTIRSLFKPDKKSDKWKGEDPDTADLQVWWLERMLGTRSPLEEKLTLFWHNHFATAISKVGVPLWMHQQNRVLRRFCLGRFRDMLHAMAKDGAMIVWLDNESNVKQAPNENFARELMELFTTGVLDRLGNPNYTEADVEEGARAFTGWGVEWPSGKFRFSEWHHDYGSKTFKGVTGDLDGTDVLDILAADPATARRLAMKLFSFFAYQVDLDDPLLDPLEQAYFDSDTRIKAMLNVLFKMDAFYSPQAMRTRVKSPMEFLIGTVRMLRGRLSRKEEWFKWHFYDLVNILGQAIFNPPSVFGWKEGLPWVSSNGLLSRLRVGDQIADSRKSTDPPIEWDPRKLLPKKKKWKNMNAVNVVDRVLAQLGSADFKPSSKQLLVDYLEADNNGNPQTFVLDNDTVDRKVRGLVALTLTSSEYQLL